MIEVKSNITNALLARPKGFTLGDKHLYIYPSTIGKSVLIGSILKDMDIDDDALESNPMAEVLRLSMSYPKEVSTIIAYATSQTKAECFDNIRTDKLISYIGENAGADDLATVLLCILIDEDYNTILKETGIQDELNEYHRIESLKDNKNNSLSFCGKTLYGTIISPACEKYGWTFDYVVWDITYLNLRLLMADSIKTTFLSEEEAKRIHTTKNKQILRADDVNNIEEIMKMDWD